MPVERWAFCDFCGWSRRDPNNECDEPVCWHCGTTLRIVEGERPRLPPKPRPEFIRDLHRIELEGLNLAMLFAFALALAIFFAIAF